MGRNWSSENSDYQIFGAEGKCENIVQRIKEIAPGSVVFDADWILGRDHIEMALYHASRAYSRKIHRVNSFENCLLLYVGLSDQIYEAKQNAGVKPATEKFVFVCPEEIERSWFLKALNLRESEKVLEFTEAKARKIFTRQELEATPRNHWKFLVFERMALLNIP
ncbi:MAG: KEOPS complex subunit Cgi121 [Thermoplasmata archaeon]|nr:KEOPS complex subunit Cgi121 [Thermoplasmata archaeon]